MKQMRHGFTLMEVLIALFVLSVSMYVLSNMQIRSVFRVMNNAEEIQRVYYVKQALYEAFLKAPKVSEKPQTREIATPETRITTIGQKIEKKSKLTPWAPYLRRITSTGTWGTGRDRRNLPIVAYVCVPKEKTP